jgi:hypothetical protein
LQNQSFRYKRSDDIADWSIETRSASHVTLEVSQLELRSVQADPALTGTPPQGSS